MEDHAPLQIPLLVNTSRITKTIKVRQVYTPDQILYVSKLTLQIVPGHNYYKYRSN